jgi:hypothetical protein
VEQPLAAGAVGGDDRLDQELECAFGLVLLERGDDLRSAPTNSRATWPSQNPFTASIPWTPVGHAPP